MRTTEACARRNIEKNEYRVVAGVDVGGARKGFHAVALRSGKYLAKFSSADAHRVAAWCRRIGARVVAIDAPCKWSVTGRARPAERALIRQRMRCFATPTRATAVAHPRNYYGWMLAGEKLYAALGRTHRLFDGHFDKNKGACVLETFPHAVVCSLAGKVVSTKRKGQIRRNLLRENGIEVQHLNSIDFVDAALCGLTASRLAARTWRCYGDVESGFIVVPTARARKTLRRHRRDG